MSEVKARANALLQESFGPSAERIRGTLRDLGFSGYAAQTFCELVRMSHATAGDLVLKTGIPDSKIYYALDELAEKGLVEVQDGKPRTYRVVPAKEVEIRLAHLVESEYEKRRAATTRLGSLLEPLRAATKSPDTDVAYIVKGLPNVVARARALISSARMKGFSASSRTISLARPGGGFACGSRCPRSRSRKTSRKPQRSARSCASASSWSSMANRS
jgi:DNA-binding transcriptional ArsR family regulator